MSGRIITPIVTGDTADEMELAALDEARRVLGPDARLAVLRVYPIHMSARTGFDLVAALGCEPKRYWAHIPVEETE